MSQLIPFRSIHSAFIPSPISNSYAINIYVCVVVVYTYHFTRQFKGTTYCMTYCNIQNYGQMRLDFGKPTYKSHQVYSILLL